MPYQPVAHAQGFEPKTWGRGPCDVSPQAAERIGARAGISIFINTPAATLNRWLHDDELVTYLEGDPTPSFRGRPTYREFADLGPFQHVQPAPYWSATTLDDAPGMAWCVNAQGGSQNVCPVSAQAYAVAVRVGDVTPVPEPPQAWLLLGGGRRPSSRVRRRGRAAA